MRQKLGRAERERGKKKHCVCAAALSVYQSVTWTEIMHVLIQYVYREKRFIMRVCKYYIYTVWPKVYGRPRHVYL